MIGNPVTRVTRRVTRRGHWQDVDSLRGIGPVTRVTRINPKRVEQKNGRAAAEAGAKGNRLWALHREIGVTRVTRVTVGCLWACVRAFGKVDRVNYRAITGMGPSPAVGLRGARSPGISTTTQKVEIPKFGFLSGNRFAGGSEA